MLHLQPRYSLSPSPFPPFGTTDHSIGTNALRGNLNAQPRWQIEITITMCRYVSVCMYLSSIPMRIHAQPLNVSIYLGAINNRGNITGPYKGGKDLLLLRLLLLLLLLLNLLFDHFSCDSMPPSSNYRALETRSRSLSGRTRWGLNIR